jgi:hypothetical protein
MSVLEDSGSSMMSNMMVLTGPPPDAAQWAEALPLELRHLTQGWVDCS